MNYGLITIDDKNLGNLWKTEKPNLITNDQLKFIINEISLQLIGYGVRPKYDTKASLKDNEKQADKYYNNYWFNVPGEALPNKK